MPDTSDKENEAVVPSKYRKLDDRPTDKEDKKRKRRSLKKALEANEHQIAEQRQLIKELKQELEQVRGATTNHHATNPDSDTDDGEHVTKKGKTSSDDHGALKSDALQAGKKYAVCNLLWLDPGVIRHVKHIAMEGSDMELSDEPEDLKEQAQNILKTLPAPLRPHVGTKWFRERFKEGGRSIRSSQVHTLIDLFPAYILPDIPAKDFADRKKRPLIPEVAAQLRDHRFLYDRDPKTPTDRLNGHLRNPCILKTLQCALYGPAVIKSGSKSSKVRKVNALIWNCKEVTIPMLGYAATVVYFILSGEAEFSEQGAQHDFRHFYDTRVKLLTKESQKKTKRFQELINYFNAELFPKADDNGDYQEGMDDEEKALDQAIEDEEEGGVEEEDTFEDE